MPRPLRVPAPVWALLIAAVGILLRAHGFWVPELWGDEYGTWWVVAGDGAGETARRALRIQGQSPLYYWLVDACTAVLGEGPLALRLPSLLASSGLVLLAWPLGLRLFRDPTLALCAVATFTLQRDFINCAQDARPYALAILLCCASMHLYAGLHARWRAGSAVCYVLATAAVFYTHYLFGTVVLAQLAHRLLARGRAGERTELTWGRVAVLAGGVALLCAPGLWQLASLFERRQALNWLPVGGVLDTARAAWGVFAWFIDFGIVGLVLLVRFALGDDARPAGDLPNRALVLCWLAVPVVVLAPLPFTHGVNLLYYRYAQAMAPAAALLMAWWIWPRAGEQGLRPLAPPLAFALGVAVLQLLPLVREHGVFAAHEPQGWRAATAALQAKARAGETVFVAAGFVESDAAARPGADPATVQFVGWPVLANLRPGHGYEIRHLPATRAAASLAADALRSLDGPAAPARIWVLGLGTGLHQFAVLAEEQHRWRAAELQAFGNVQLLLLVR